MNRFGKFLNRITSDEEFVTFYPTYGYREGDFWKIPMRLWVYEHRKMVEGLFSKLSSRLGATNEREKENFKKRICHIVADSESREKVTFQFENDKEAVDYRLTDESGQEIKSTLNGVVKGVLTLSTDDAERLLKSQNSNDGWLTIHATSKDHTGSGRIRLIAPEGVSVISDIDDTIKETELPAGGKIVVRNTFFKDFVASEGMAVSYEKMDDAVFHYVSGGPWQMFDPIWKFLSDEGFPEGTIHMKSVPKNFLSPTTWQDLYKLMGDATLEQKLSQISEILKHFPQRKFILIGDSGEHDPDVYNTIKESFGEQIQEIRMRDVVNARELDPKRLEGMTIIEAPTIVNGVSNLPDN